MHECNAMPGGCVTADQCNFNFFFIHHRGSRSLVIRAIKRRDYLPCNWKMSSRFNSEKWKVNRISQARNSLVPTHLFEIGWNVWFQVTAIGEKPFCFQRKSILTDLYRYEWINRWVIIKCRWQGKAESSDFLNSRLRNIYSGNQREISEISVKY